MAKKNKKQNKTTNYYHIFLTAFVFSLTISASLLWFLNSKEVTKGDTERPQKTIQEQTEALQHQGKHVVVYLHEMKLELRDGATVLTSLPLLSQGKPGSYYETMGGNYSNDHKTPLHFSSIGHVYMPYSIHVFGNYFIHGVPYYPDGTPVASTYSGGCIRLANNHAKEVYDFVERGTPIIITRSDDKSFAPTKIASTTLSSIEVTNLMVAAVSLELLTQDNPILDTDGMTQTTRRNLLPRLLKSGDTAVSKLYAKSIGEEAFISAMNQKAKSLGLSNTSFSDLESSVETTYDDYERFMTYISTYKSYLRSL